MEKLEEENDSTSQLLKALELVKEIHAELKLKLKRQAQEKLLN